MAKAPADVRSLARQHTKGAIHTLEGIMYEKTAPHAARVAAACALLDRGWGKAKQESELTIRRVAANELGDDQLASIAAGGRARAIEAEEDTPILN